MAALINQVLPQRMQMAERDMLVALWSHRRIPKRQLVKALYLDLRDVGIPGPRGKTFPPTGDMQEMLDVHLEALKIVFGKETQTRECGNPN